MLKFGEIFTYQEILNVERNSLNLQFMHFINDEKFLEQDFDLFILIYLKLNLWRLLTIFGLSLSQ